MDSNPNCCILLDGCPIAFGPYKDCIMLVKKVACSQAHFEFGFSSDLLENISEKEEEDLVKRHIKTKDYALTDTNCIVDHFVVSRILLIQQADKEWARGSITRSLYDKMFSMFKRTLKNYLREVKDRVQ